MEGLTGITHLTHSAIVQHIRLCMENHGDFRDSVAAGLADAIGHVPIDDEALSQVIVATLAIQESWADERRALADHGQ